ncbi:YitT family protein [Paenibacillus lemnae]|uniref:YitT family protein n=1 Tax=Paenibacillus lemnae TaxID=1330551 RepID=A0A848MA75_PAELE|nr:YitT family protein [Paenibacillus lemnae]NMO96813.1 YitT family protein [Paenibacillus lemnae]
MTVLGSMIAAFGLDMFLVPNGFIAGGMTGVSALASQITGVQTGLFLLMLNLPLMILLQRTVQQQQHAVAIVGLVVFSGCSLLFHPLPALLEASAGAAAIGGVMLGLGIGIGIRHGAVLDMLQSFNLPGAVLAALNHLRLRGTVIIVNLVLLSLAGLLLSLEQALYSAVACLLALESARFAVSGFSLHFEASVQTAHSQFVQDALEQFLGVSAIQDQDQDKNTVPSASLEQRQILNFKVHVLEIARFKVLLRSADPQASLSIKRWNNNLAQNQTEGTSDTA